MSEVHAPPNGCMPPLQEILDPPLDLIGELNPPSKSRHKFALTVICMLTGYIFCIPLKTKSASEVVQAYIDHVYAKFGGSLQILSNSGTEFKNKMFEEVAHEVVAGSNCRRRNPITLIGLSPGRALFSVEKIFSIPCCLRVGVLTIIRKLKSLIC